MGAAMAVAVAVAAARSAGAEPGGPTYLTLATPSPIAIVREAPGRPQQVPVPVVLAAGVDLAKLDATVLNVVRDGAVQPNWPSTIRALLSSQPPTLTLTLDPGALLAPDAYDVTVGLALRPDPGAPASAPARQEVVVRLRVPAAALQPIAKLVIDREVPVPFLGYAHEEPRVMTLRETSTRSPISPVVTQEGSLTSGDRPIGARITVGAFAQIEPGGTGSAELALSGDLPMGTTSGVLWVTARELPAPIAVPIEIRSHRPAWWVPLLFALGAVGGLMWRSRLVARQNELRARLRVARLGAEIDRFLDEHPPDWLEDVTALRSRRRELRPDRPETMVAAEQALRSARDKRDARLEQLAERIRGGIAVTRIAWRLPMGLDLVAVAEGYELARAGIEQGELPAATRREASAAVALDGVVTRCRDWCARLDKGLALDHGLLTGIPAGARAAVSAALAGLQSALAAAAGPPPKPEESSKPEDGLQKMSEAWSAAAELVDLLREVFAGFVRSLPAGLTAEATAWLRGAVVLPASPPDRPDLAITEAIAAGRRLRDALRAVATELDDGELSDARREAIERGDFAAAVTPPAGPVTRGRGSPISSVREVVASARGEIEVGISSSLAVVRPATPAVPAVAAISVRGRRNRSLDEILEDKLAAVHWVRWAIAAAITSLAAWAIYGGAFIGTRIECVALLGFGFVTDLTTDSAIEGMLARIRAAAGAGAVGGTLVGGAPSPSDPGAAPPA